MKKRFRNIFIVFAIFALFFVSLPDYALAEAYDPTKDYKKLEVRFWEDEQPDIGFYINSTARYTLHTVDTPSFGTFNGEWSVMNLLRGLYTGYSYVNELEPSYFEGYIQRVEDYVNSKNGNLDRNKSTEWSRAILALTALGYDITNVAGYDFIDKLSESFRFTLRQGINGPIWVIIAMNTGGYEFYSKPEYSDPNSFGRMIDYILDNEIEQEDGTVGGWALGSFTKSGPDPDITGMALQALAPYYLDEEKYEKSGAETPYKEFQLAVERGVKALAELQAENGAFKAFGQVNTESTAQVIVALTALGIDPLSTEIHLPTLDEDVTFVTDGAFVDNVKTDNLIDALLTFWTPVVIPDKDVTDDADEDEKIAPVLGGFKHVTFGYDGGGGSGYDVNAMATDQGLYALIAYDRFRKGLPSLYDMSDMKNGEYLDLLARENNQKVTFIMDHDIDVKEQSPFGAIKLKKPTAVEGKQFIGWNSKADGNGTMYQPDEYLVIPEHDITLYAQYDLVPYELTYELNGGSFVKDVPTRYTVEEEIVLPNAKEVEREGYQFVGWYDNYALEGEPIQKLDVGTTGNKTLYAKWEALPMDKVEANMVEEITNLIANLPSIDEVDLKDEGVIERVQAGYSRLPTRLKEQVDNREHLSNLANKIVEIKESRVKELEEDIEKIELSTNNEENLFHVNNNERNAAVQEIISSIEEVRERYYALSVAEQKLLKEETKDYFHRLEKDYFTIQELSEEEAKQNIAALRLKGLRISDVLSEDEKETINQTLKFINEHNLSQVFTEEVKELNNVLEAEEVLEQAVTELIESIEALPSREEITLEDVDAVLSVKESYENLNEYDRLLVSNIQKLLILLEEIEQMKENPAEIDDEENGQEVEDSQQGNDEIQPIEDEAKEDKKEQEGTPVKEEDKNLGSVGNIAIEDGNLEEKEHMSLDNRKGETEKVEAKHQAKTKSDKEDELLRKSNSTTDNELEKEEQQLPLTSTQIYRWIALGIGLILLGYFMHHFRIRKV